MYESNQAIQETCTIVKNMPNDEGNLYFQVFNSKGNLIAIDIDEFKRKEDQREIGDKYSNQEIERLQKERERERDEFNRVRQKWNTDFDKLKDAKSKQQKLGGELIQQAIGALGIFKTLAQRHFKSLSKKQLESFHKAEKFFAELNSMDSKYAATFANNDLIDKYVDVPDRMHNIIR